MSTWEELQWGGGQEEAKEKRWSWGTRTVKAERGITGWKKVAKQYRRVEGAGLIFGALGGSEATSPLYSEKLIVRNSLL